MNNSNINSSIHKQITFIIDIYFYKYTIVYILNTTYRINPFHHKSVVILKYMETALNFPVTGNLDSVIGIN